MQLMLTTSVHQWTAEYIINILEIIQTGIKNYSTEEFLKKLNPVLYATYVDHRKLIMEVYFCMEHIQGYHRHFLWNQFGEAYGMNPKDYFLAPL